MGRSCVLMYFFFFFQAEDGIRDVAVTGVQTCALPISTLKEETIMGGEDFNFYMEELRGRQIPGVFMMVGGANEKAGIERGDHHTPDFRVDPKVLQEMSAIHASFVINYFNTIKNQKHD